MKISKLFHWLYASVMLMPLFAIGFKCLYVTFNPNAKDSYYGQSINESENNYVNSNNFIPNNTYYFNTSGYDGNSLLNIYIGNANNQLTFENINIITNTSNFDLSNCNKISFWKNTNSNILYMYAYTDNTLIFSERNISNFNLVFSFTYLSNNLIDDLLEYTDLFYFIEYNDYSYIDNVFYYSVEQIGNEPIFNWANNTFLSSPLLYITNLFGVPSTSPIITLLCFWFSISIIWLVFDMLMYVPLLVHRWLDKGVLE